MCHHQYLARTETSGAPGLIHLDSSAASLSPSSVLEVHINALKKEAKYGPYQAARRWEGELQEVYQLVAKLVSAQPEEISIVENASRAWNAAFSIVSFEARDIIVTSEYEYVNNYYTILKASERTGASIIILKTDEFGDISLPLFKDLLRDFGNRIRLISITHVPTHNAIIHPVQLLGQMINDAKRNGTLSEDALFFVDACQSIGQLGIDVEEISCDVLTGSGRKYLRGPRGTGILYFKRQSFERLVENADLFSLQLTIPGINWNEDGTFSVLLGSGYFETWETSYSARMALCAALKYNQKIDQVWAQQHSSCLTNYCRLALSEIDEIEMFDRGRKRANAITFSLRNRASKAVFDELEHRGVNVSLLDRRVAQLAQTDCFPNALLRASFHYYNTEHDCEKFCSIIKEICRVNGNA